MKKFYVCSFLCMLFACTNDPQMGIRDESKDEPSVSYAVPLEDALAQMYEVMDVLYTSTRSGHKEIKSIETMKSSDLNPATRSSSASITEELVYIVNFGEEEGFAVLAAHRGFPSVICITEQGSLTVSELRALQVETKALKLALTEEQLRMPYLNVHSYRDEDAPETDNSPYVFEDYNIDWDPEDSVTADTDDFMTGSIDDSFIKKQLVNYVSAIGDKPYLEGDLPIDEPTPGVGSTTKIVYGDWANTTKKGPFLRTKWHQEFPFNAEKKERYAGCVAIALAQIFAYNESPTLLLYGVSSSWKALKNQDYTTEESDNNRKIYGDIAKIVREIAIGCKMHYNYFGSGQSFATPAAAKRHMKSIGYTGVEKKTGYKTRHITSMINKGYPVFIGAISGSSSGHAWVIDGTLDQQRIKYTYDLKGNLLKTATETRLLVHCNFGWAGLSDGYYESGVFNLRTGPVSAEEGIDRNKPGSTEAYYSWWFRTITYSGFLL